MSDRHWTNSKRSLAPFVLVLASFLALPFADAVAAKSAPKERVVMGWLEYGEVRIKAHGGKLVSRPVVTMDFCLNGSTHEAQFTLTDRGNFLYPVLLGRRFLEDVAVIDPAATYLATSVCESAGKEGKKKPKQGQKKR